MRYIWYTLLALFVLCALVLSDDIGTTQLFVIQKTHGNYVLRHGIKTEHQAGAVVNGLKERGVPSDSLWFLWSLVAFDTTGGILTVSLDSLMNMTVPIRVLYDLVDVIPTE